MPPIAPLATLRRSVGLETRWGAVGARPSDAMDSVIAVACTDPYWLEYATRPSLTVKTARSEIFPRGTRRSTPNSVPRTVAFAIDVGELLGIHGRVARDGVNPVVRLGH